MLAKYLALLLCATTASAFNVTYDSHSFSLDGERKLFFSGSFHYPRAPPAEWPGILAAMKASGLNMVQTYVFWDVHEPTEGVYNFPTSKEDENNLVLFLSECQQAGLYVHLRIGPYACAEWNNGGLPVWLRKEGVVWRTDDDYFLTKMKDFIDETLRVVEQAGLLAKDDGPIIMAQIENENGDVEGSYGKAGETYVEKIGNFALAKTELMIPWVMCKQGEGLGGTDPPSGIISSCNGYYCDNWISDHAAVAPNHPHLFTENWPGWFQKWGEAIPHRPATDVSFSVARWVLKGGSFMNYYMAFGGTTFGRKVGGPNIIPSYDYDAQINEFGLPKQPKYDLLTALHNAFYTIQDTIFSQDPPEAVPIEGTKCETHTFSSGVGDCVTFVSNIEEEADQDDCTFNGFSIPSWSVSIITGCSADSQELLFSTKENSIIERKNELTAVTSDITFKSIEKTYTETIPPTGDNIVTQNSDSPLEQLSLTDDTTDYLWYSGVFKSLFNSDSAVVEFTAATGGGLCYYLYVNSIMQSTQCGTQNGNLFTSPVTFSNVAVIEGDNDITIMSVSMGLKNYGANLERSRVGIVGEILVDGEVMKGWTHTVGINGPPDASLDDKNFFETNTGMTWFELKFDSPLPGDDDEKSGLALDLSSMGKGFVSVNGRMLGRYWSIVGENTNNCEECDLAAYAGSYGPDTCRSGCGEESQRYYKMPRSWLNEDGEENVVTIFEEVGGGDVNNVSVVKMLMV